MNNHVGIDMPLEASSVCVVDGNGKIACEGTAFEQFPKFAAAMP